MTGLDELPLRPELVGQTPYGAPQLDVAVLLNVNENPYPPSAELRAELAAAVHLGAATMNRYPDREAWQLRQALAGYLGHGLGPEQVWAANGSNEIMTQLLGAFGGPGRCALGFRPSYSMYPEYARNSHTSWLTVPRAADFTLDADAALAAIATHRPDVVIVASPNNPTGTATSHATVAAIASAAPGMVVVDEAYHEFARPGGDGSAIQLLGQFPRLVVTRTMSKAFGFAGGRLGYLAASSAVVDACRIVRLPYHLSGLTQLAARVALSHAPELLAHVDTIRAERDRTVTWLRAQQLQVADSDANFVMFGRFDEPAAVWQALLDRGVLIRHTGPAGWLRVSIGTAADMDQFRAALAEILADDLGNLAH